MSVLQFFSRQLSKQLIDVIQWTDPEDAILSFRYPMQDMEIQTGAQLTVGESQMAAFVHEGHIADIFSSGLHTLDPQNLPILADLLNWDRGFDSPFKSDVYFFSTRPQIDQKWSTTTPITIRDEEFGAVRVRCFGICSYRIAYPRTFFTQTGGTHETYFVSDLEGQLRNTITARITELLAACGISVLDLSANLTSLNDKIILQMKPAFAGLGLELNQFAVQNISLPEELQKPLEQHLGINTVADIGAGSVLTQAMSKNITATPEPAAFPTAASSPLFCIHCGETIPLRATFCPFCGKQQQ